MTQLYRPSAETGPIHSNWITLHGPDARDFLHRLTTVHVRNLAVGEGKPGCFLNAQGKIRASFTLWNCEPGQYAFEMDSGEADQWKARLLTLIDEYTFGEKISIKSDTSDPALKLQTIWLFPEPHELQDLLKKEGLESLKEEETRLTSANIRFCHQNSACFGRPWISVWGKSENLSLWLDRIKSISEEIPFSTLESWRIESLQPRVDTEISESTIPLEIGLQNSIAQSKGCYPGQEVIERIIALGAPPRRLALLHLEGPTPKRGDPIF